MRSSKKNTDNNYIKLNTKYITMLAFLVTIITIVVNIAFVYAQDNAHISELEQQQQQIKEKQEELSKDVNHLSQRNAVVEDKLSRMGNDISVIKKDVKEILKNGNR